MTKKRDKVNVDDIIGLVDCEPTNSVEEIRKLRGKEENNFYWYKKYKEVLNENEQLKQENERLCNFNLHMLLDEKNKEIEQLKSEINMLKITIGRNEGYIDRLTHKGEWR